MRTTCGCSGETRLAHRFRASEVQPIEVALLPHVCFDLESFKTPSVV